MWAFAVTALAKGIAKTAESALKVRLTGTRLQRGGADSSFLQIAEIRTCTSVGSSNEVPTKSLVLDHNTHAIHPSKSDSSSHFLRMNFSEYFPQACVATRHFSIALPVLSVPIINIDTTLSDLSYNDNLIYHYAGGMALGALKMWREAEEFFEICVSAPAQVPAAIQLEALKKLTLVQLILYGKVPSFSMCSW